eukprot:c22605_g1_i1 orf=285-473(+)
MEEKKDISTFCPGVLSGEDGMVFEAFEDDIRWVWLWKEGLWISICYSQNTNLWPLTPHTDKK